MEMWLLALAAFLVTVVLVLWRPGGIHEAIPALLGAFGMFLLGLVNHHDAWQVASVVFNSALTILSTFVMAAILDRTGFFKWAADRIIERSQDSGHRLFHLVLAFSACLTVFLNNDGSILLGTPIMIGLVKQLKMPRMTAFAYLFGACIIASAASPPIGVSNMANLEAMALVGITLTEHLHAVLIPSLVGLTACWALLYAAFSRSLPRKLSEIKPEILPPMHPPRPYGPGPHPHPHPSVVPHHHMPMAHAHLPPMAHHRPAPPPPPPHRPKLTEELPPPTPDYPFMWFAVVVVVLVRIGFFVASAHGVKTYVVAVAGALILLAVNLLRPVVQTREAVSRAPWAILGFAFGMDLVVFGLRNAGITGMLARLIGPTVVGSAAGASFLPGLLTGGVAAVLNNHPGLIIGSLTLIDIENMSRATLDVAYAGVVLGTDLGALITPVGTLASLIWLHMLHQEGMRYTWGEYLRVALGVIPLAFVLSLATLWGVALVLGR